MSTVLINAPQINYLAELESPKLRYVENFQSMSEYYVLLFKSFGPITSYISSKQSKVSTYSCLMHLLQ